ncbi:F5/8 type C domain-containing protein [Paenibacillus sp. 1_12]|uniref:S-layer homology domain-containing protein n=1 Tax=Paenibacillus sp. 1_12 TaxID=1566278 RepID=UPI0008EC5966|nr:S-layer homology domain-containing protein [Paenibacillus sp. 1_12]SFM30139.1 F5/8 type C domain-containing protein [Paenibacillus sp. 1_12]
MIKKFNKRISILLVFTFIISLGILPEQAARAASSKTDIAPSTLTSNINVKASSENSTKKATFAVDHTGGSSSLWQIGGTATNIFPEEGKTSSLWLAIDLGSVKTFDEVSFDIPTVSSNVYARMSDYEVVYTSNANTWTNLPALNNSSRTTYDWGADSWTLAKKVTVPSSIVPSDPNWGSLTPINADWTATTTGTFTAPVTARYVMIHFTLKYGKAGAIGMSNLKILKTADAVLPKYADTYLNEPGSGYAIITPDYPGMNLTIGRPAVIDANAASRKFPVFNIKKALSGTSITGTLLAPDGSKVYSFPVTHVDAGGNAVMSIPDSITLAKGTYRVEFALSNNGNTFYDSYYFTAIPSFRNYMSTPNTINSNNANVANVNPDSWTNHAYPALQLDGSGKIFYAPDYKGNQVMDYSAVGYQGGGVAIPNVPVRVKVAPLANNTEDSWQAIQDAIDYVSIYPIQSDGFRGAVYLEPGVFRISKPLNVTTSGVVIRGAGSGTVTPIVGDGSVQNPYDEQIASEGAEPGVTKLISTWKLTDSFTPSTDHATTTGSPYSKGSNSTLINFNGQGVTQSASTTITDQYVGAGQYAVHVASTSGLSVGDSVSVQKAINVNWVKAMYMDNVDGASNWLPNGNLESGFAGTPFTSERTIKSIDTVTNKITFTEPLADNLDMRWGVSKVVKIVEDGRIKQVGVENIQGISHFYNTTKPSLSRYGDNYRSYNDENHAQVFVAMVNVRDGWMRNFTTYHIDSAFVTEGNSRNITVQDGNVLDPVSLMDAGERRYSIYFKKSEFMFTQRVYSRYMRHAFIVDSYTSGPNVFYNSTSEYTSNASEPHFRWSSGGLYDNVAARIYLQNRWNMGTSHGWAGVNYLLYNFTGPFIATQPQLTPNYVIGHLFDSNTNRLGSATDPLTGRQKTDKTDSANMASAGLNGGKVPNFEAYEYSMTNKVTPAANNMPDSLYVKQLINSHGAQAATILTENTVPPINDQSSTQRPKLIDLKVGGQTLSGFSPDIYRYSYTLPLDYDYSKKVEVTAQAGAGITVDIAYPQDISSEMVQITLTDAKGVKNFYSVSMNMIYKSPIVAASDQQVDSSNFNYAVNVLNPADYAGSNSLRWAASGSAWIRMYLGETTKRVTGVQVGFIQHATNTRFYKLRVEYSMDGQNWSYVPSGTVTSDTTASPVSWNNEADTYINSLTLNPANVLSAANTLQTFMFDKPVQARFIRIAGNGNTTGTASNAWNSYWRLRPAYEQADLQYTAPTGVAISGPSTLNSTDSIQLQALITPNTATVKEVVWTSSNPAIATVDSTGKVTAAAAGKVTITATTVDGKFISAGVLQQAASTHDLIITKSSNADLSDLTLSNGILSPAFAADTMDYTSYVAVGVPRLTVTAIVFDTNATMTVNGNQVISGQESGDIQLQIGGNTINVAVTAEDGTTKTYNIIVNRLPGNSVSSGGGGISNQSGSKETATDGKLTLPVGKSGEVSLGGEIIISIPANATDKELKLTIEKVMDTKALLKNNQVLASSIFEILKNFPENFNNSITLTFTFDPASYKSNQRVGIFYYDELKQVWEEVKGGKINGNTITAEVNHFTKYAVLVVDPVTDKPNPVVSLYDIPGHWAEININKAVSKGIISGYPDGTFKPDHTVTRAEFVVMLMNTRLPQGEGATLSFTDNVEIGSWAQNAVARALQAGIVKGYEDGSFWPNAEITRAEMALMLANAYGLAIDADTVTGFADDKDVPDWSKGAVAVMKKQKLLEGKGDNTFAPLAPATRAEAVTVLLNLSAQ